MSYYITSRKGCAPGRHHEYLDIRIPSSRETDALHFPMHSRRSHQQSGLSNVGASQTIEMPSTGIIINIINVTTVMTTLYYYRKPSQRFLPQLPGASPAPSPPAPPQPPPPPWTRRRRPRIMLRRISYILSYIILHITIHMCICIYIYIERERESEIDR